jgi:hypothetical protein
MMSLLGACVVLRQWHDARCSKEIGRVAWPSARQCIESCDIFSVRAVISGWRPRQVLRLARRDR